MIKVLSVLALLVSFTASARTYTYTCEDTEAEASFIAKFTAKGGSVNMTMDEKTVRLPITNITTMSRPNRAYLFTSQAFMDENILMGFLLATEPSIEQPRSTVTTAKIFYYDRQSNDILGYDETANFKCAMVTK